jgi:hypothetical protein
LPETCRPTKAHHFLDATDKMKLGVKFKKAARAGRPTPLFPSRLPAKSILLNTFRDGQRARYLFSRLYGLVQNANLDLSRFVRIL